MNNNLSLYNIFLAVAEAGSTLGAAKTLFISQPAVSKAISKLEASLEVSLFVRSKKGVRLTDDGLILYDRIKNAFEYIDEGESVIRERNSLGTGHIKIGVSSTLCKYILLPYLSLYTKDHPHIRISIECHSSRETADILQQNHVDLGLIAKPDNSTLSCLSLGYMHDTFVATREYLSNMAKRNDANLMMLNKENLTRQYVDRYIPARFYEKFNLMETDNMELLIEFAKTGIGIGCVIKEFVKKELGNGLLVEYNTGLPEIEKREVCFAYSYRRMPNPHVIDFLDYVNEKKSDKKFNVLV